MQQRLIEDTAKGDKADMVASEKSFWHEFFREWPLWSRVGLGIISVMIVLFIVFGVSFLVVERQEDIEISVRGFKAKRPETTLEKNCRMASQESSAWDESINREILALQAQVAIKDHDLSEIRQKCLTTLPNADRLQTESRCRTEISQSDGRTMATFANPRGDYETELTSTAEERQALESKIAAKEQERAQWRRQLEQRCLAPVLK